MPIQKFGTNKKGSNVKVVCFHCSEEKPNDEVQTVGRVYVCDDCLEDEEVGLND